MFDFADLQTIRWRRFLYPHQPPLKKGGGAILVHRIFAPTDVDNSRFFLLHFYSSAFLFREARGERRHNFFLLVQRSGSKFRPFHQATLGVGEPPVVNER